MGGVTTGAGAAGLGSLTATGTTGTGATGTGAGTGAAGVGVTGAAAGADGEGSGAGSSVVPAGAASGAVTGITPLHCLQRIFFPSRALATFVCQWHDGHFTGIEVADWSPVMFNTMGVTAFLGAAAGGEVSAGAGTGSGNGAGGGATTGSSGAGSGGRAGAAATGGSATTAGGSGVGTGGGGVTTAVSGSPCGADDSLGLGTGIILPHLGHLTSVGVRIGDVLIFSLALQCKHSRAITFMGQTPLPIAALRNSALRRTL